MTSAPNRSPSSPEPGSLILEGFEHLDPDIQAALLQQFGALGLAATEVENPKPVVLPVPELQPTEEIPDPSSFVTYAEFVNFTTSNGLRGGHTAWNRVQSAPHQLGANNNPVKVVKFEAIYPGEPDEAATVTAIGIDGVSELLENVYLCWKIGSFGKVNQKMWGDFIDYKTAQGQEVDAASK